MKREVVALFILPLLYLYIMKLPVIFFFFLWLLVVVICQIEFYTMYRVGKVLATGGIFSGAFLLWAVYSDMRDLSLVIAFLVLGLLSLRLLMKEPTGAIQEVAPVVLGLFYLPFVLSLMIKLREVAPGWVIYTAGTVWGADSFAYYIGKTFGRRRLYPSVSPKKTVEGAVGSIIGGAICSILIGLLLLNGLKLLNLFLVGMIIGIASIVGDLTESMFKRDAGVKDSGTLLPGHGGVLDKMDGIIYATPIVYTFVRLSM